MGYTYDVHENDLTFKTPHSPCPSTSHIFPPPWPWTSNFKQTPPSSTTTFSNKLWNNNRTAYVDERNQKKNKTKSRQIRIYYVFYCSIYHTNNAMVLLKDGFTVWQQSQ